MGAITTITFLPLIQFLFWDKIEGAREVCIDLLQNHWMQWKANYEAMPEAERDEIYDHF